MGHARATRASVSLKQEGDALVLEIVDDGSSPQGAFTAGRGMTGMQERVMSVGGELRITRDAPHGTRVWARLPLPSTDVEA